MKMGKGIGLTSSSHLDRLHMQLCDYELDNPTGVYLEKTYGNKTISNYSFMFDLLFRRRNKEEYFQYILEKAKICLSKHEYQIINHFVRNRLYAYDQTLGDIRITEECWIPRREAEMVLRSLGGYNIFPNRFLSERQMVRCLEHTDVYDFRVLIETGDYMETDYTEKG